MLGRTSPIQAQSRASVYRQPGPVQGLVTNRSKVMPADGAAVLQNWIPTRSGARVRSGMVKHATLTSPGTSVERIWSYGPAGNVKLFASDSGNVYDASTPADPDVPLTPVITGQSGGHYSVVNVNILGTNNQVIFNGLDTAKKYDGTSWTDYAPTDVDSATIIDGFVYASRLVLIERDSLNVWIGEPGVLGDTYTKFPLDAVFVDSSVLLRGLLWSQNIFGIIPRLAFITNDGEVAIYQSTGPLADDLELTYRFKLPRPLGRFAFENVGGDIIAATTEGILPFSQAIQKDPAALSLSAITTQIELDWLRAAKTRITYPWELVKWDGGDLLFTVTPPNPQDGTYAHPVANVETGAWCTVTNWPVRCMAVRDENLYFGTDNGLIYLAFSGGNDDGAAYVAAYVSHPSDMGMPSVQKTAGMARGAFTHQTPINPNVGASTDYSTTLISAPASVPDFSGDLWDVGLWDQMKWDVGSPDITTTQWQSVGRTGFSVSPQVLITSGTTVAPAIELVSLEITYQTGAVAV